MGSLAYEKKKESILAYQDKMRKIIREAKSHPCLDCGVEYPFYIMQFDHVRGPKLFNLSSWMGQSIPRIKAEIAKCEVVCANCHAARTYKRISEIGAFSKQYNLL